MRLCRIPTSVVRNRRLSSRRTVGIDTPSRLAASRKLTVAGGALGAAFVDMVLMHLNYGRGLGNSFDFDHQLTPIGGDNWSRALYGLF